MSDIKSSLSYESRPVIFRQSHQDIGTFALCHLEPKADSSLMHNWFSRDYARFWNMGHYSQKEIECFYEKMNASGHAAAFIGYCDSTPAFIMESYDPLHDQVGRHYDVLPGDWGMHFLVAPPQKTIPGFTLAIIRTVLAYHFQQRGIRRLVVEPDVRNDKVHALNRKVGFVYAGTVELEEKTAALAFVTRRQFQATIKPEENA